MTPRFFYLNNYVGDGTIRRGGEGSHSGETKGNLKPVSYSCQP